MMKGGLQPKACPICLHEFLPKKKEQQVCSKACASQMGTAKLAKLKREGHDPAHGGKAKEARQASLARRRATGELLGRQLQQARKQGLISSPDEHRKKEQKPKQALKPDPPAIPVLPTAQGQADINHATLSAMQAAYGASGMRYERLVSRHEQRKHPEGVLVLAGYGASLSVRQQALVVYPGKTHAEQQATTRTYYRGMERPQQIVFLNDMPGNISLDALVWCKEQDISLHVLNLRSQVTQTMPATSKEDIALRRKQYAASGSGHSIALARAIVEKKLRSQLHTLQAHLELPRCQQAVSILHNALTWFEMERPMVWLERLDILRTYEGRAAKAYFAAWAGLPLHWHKQDTKKIPPHWLAVRERTSPLSSNGRHAVDPCNAMLNYAYACLESQCRQALLSYGFDIACGVLHADQQGRDSLVFDLMELYRAKVDARLLTLLQQTTFHQGDMTLANDGSIRFHPEFARYLVARCKLPQNEIDMGALWLKNQLLIARERVQSNEEETAHVG